MSIDLVKGVKLLTPFCSTDMVRPSLCSVWHIGDSLCATNDHYCAKLVLDDVKPADVPEGFPVGKCDKAEGSFPDVSKVIWDNNKSDHNYLEFDSSRLYERNGLIDTWIKAFKFISSLKSECKSIILGKTEHNLLACSVDESDANSLGTVMRLAKNGDYKESPNADVFWTRWNSKYLLTIMQTIKELHPAGPVRFGFRKGLTGSMKIEAGPLTVILVPVRDDGGELLKLFCDVCGHRYDEFESGILKK